MWVRFSIWFVRRFSVGVAVWIPAYHVSKYSFIERVENSLDSWTSTSFYRHANKHSHPLIRFSISTEDWNARHWRPLQVRVTNSSNRPSTLCWVVKVSSASVMCWCSAVFNWRIYWLHTGQIWFRSVYLKIALESSLNSWITSQVFHQCSGPVWSVQLSNIC